MASNLDRSDKGAPRKANAGAFAPTSIDGVVDPRREYGLLPPLILDVEEDYDNDLSGDGTNTTVPKGVPADDKIDRGQYLWTVRNVNGGIFLNGNQPVEWEPVLSSQYQYDRDSKTMVRVAG